jgi:type I restriction enzyme R subunit
MNHYPYVYLSTGELTKFIDFTDPKPRSRELFSFHRPETLLEWVKQKESLRSRLLDLPILAQSKDCAIAK